MQDNAGQILTNFTKNRTLQDNEGQILKVRTMQDCIHHVLELVKCSPPRKPTHIDRYLKNGASKIVVHVRSIRSQMFFKIGFLKNFTNFTGKHLCWSVFLIKLPETLYFLRTPLL